MGRRIALALWVVASCGDDEPASSTEGASAPTTTTMPASSSTDVGSETSTADSSGTSEGSSTAAPEPCEGAIPGEWADCIDEDGEVDLVPCMFDESSGGAGTPFCLVSASDPMAGACTVLSCETDCDCFAMPTSGTAPAKCGAFLDGGKACALPCGGDAICPDGMECSSGLCFWPAGGAADTGTSTTR
jgi:hypothetical protein